MNAKDFFGTDLPAKLTRNAAAAKAINSKYQINITGAGQWNLDLTSTGPTCTEGEAPADCSITMSAADFPKFMKNPKAEAMTMMLFGKLKVSGNMGLAMKLEKALSFA